LQATEFAGQRVPDLEQGQWHRQAGEENILVAVHGHFVAHLEQQPECTFDVVHNTPVGWQLRAGPGCAVACAVRRAGRPRQRPAPVSRPARGYHSTWARAWTKDGSSPSFGPPSTFSTLPYSSVKRSRCSGNQLTPSEAMSIWPPVMLWSLNSSVL